jgi:hypothetical protein
MLTRFGAGVVVHREALWILGGAGDRYQTYMNDAWFEQTNGYNCIPPVRMTWCLVILQEPAEYEKALAAGLPCVDV